MTSSVSPFFRGYISAVLSKWLVRDNGILRSPTDNDLSDEAILLLAEGLADASGETEEDGAAHFRSVYGNEEPYAPSVSDAGLIDLKKTET
jgi:hypothetical protein